MRRLFAEHLDKEYTEAEYVQQFTVRIPENLAKLDRMDAIYADIADAPQAMLDELAAQRVRLVAMQAAKGDYVSPMDL